MQFHKELIISVLSIDENMLFESQYDFDDNATVFSYRTINMSK